GIGTNTPAAKLDVKGDIVSSGKISSQNSRVIASAGNTIQSPGSSDWADMPDMAVDITTGNNMLLVLFKAGGLYLEGPSQDP
ncbi:MAG: hypothetical protein GTN53_43340, partial [Candidatus Aminicenantes bacterium]|nr:hypothetical protein [Candidatus Aminicenantes bacterium]NIQ73321.1 hypothetical protein [Candidatus Aminicenantes bacterium]NIT29353.1 hypothetical protein [Candidatus Aminicenantes bacterium]